MNLKKYLDAVNSAQARVNEIAARINTHFEANETEQALALRPELDDAKAAYNGANSLYLSMVNALGGSQTDPAQRFVPVGGEPEPAHVRDMRASNEYTQAFFSALRLGATPQTIQNGVHRAEQFGVLMNALTETGGSPAGSEGGFLLPVDFDNMIKLKLRAFVDLAQQVNVEEVTAYSGWRAVESTVASNAFAALTENQAMSEMESPTFAKVTYTIVDYGGYLPVTNDLLADTPANIMNYLSGWVAKKIALTNDSRILALINALSPTAVATTGDQFAAIKTALNKTLDPAVSAGASVITNQTGFDILDQINDGTGRPLLQPDPSNATAYRILGRPCVVVPDRIWSNMTSTDRARVAIGDGRQFATLFRRSPVEMASTAVGGDSWRKNNTEVRAIYRIDEAVMDTDAMALLTLAF